MNRVNSYSSFKILHGHDLLEEAFAKSPASGSWISQSDIHPFTTMSYRAHSPHYHLSICLFISPSTIPPHFPLCRLRFCNDLKSEAAGARMKLLLKVWPMGPPELLWGL